ncbi:MAG: hypothetical protein AMS18_15885 [Gemmatimonas sp. SG8_17]|nr:MAG: hypothetical protein AMS18_15885 [Gemmatimonas sp. SG8_17]
MTFKRWVTVVSVVAVPWVSLEAQSVHYEGAVSVASGNYIFTQRTTSWTLSNGLALSAGPFTLRGSVPLYRQNTSLIAGLSTGLLPTGGSSGRTVADSAAARGRGAGGHPSLQVTAASSYLQEAASLAEDPVEVPTTAVTGYRMVVGDPSLGLGIVALQQGGTSVNLGAGLKIPLTDTSGYGTGQWDVGGSVSLSQIVGRSTLIGFDVGYWHLGDLPELDLRDALMGSASIAYLGRSGWGGSALVSAARSVVEGFADAYTAGVAVSRVARRATISVNLSLGFTETTPDFSLGLSWRIGIS